LRRSSRIVLLIGVLLAVVAFVGIVVLSRPAPVATPNPSAQTTPTVFAAIDIPLGTKITSAMVRQQETRNAERGAGAFNSTSLVIGKVIRRSVVMDAQLTAADFESTGTLGDTVETPAGLRAIAVTVDQATGVGTIIKTGDYVDMVVGVTDTKMLVHTTDEHGEPTITDPGDLLNSTSVKVLIQGLQVLGTLLPPPPVDAQGRPLPQTAVTLNNRQELVILAVTPQQAEIIKFAQMDGNISLVLRAPADFIGPDGQPVVPPVTPTTGIVLKTLVDQHGVLIPQIVATIFEGP
jgi:Flp pilus assembly protein CpaB